LATSYSKLQLPRDKKQPSFFLTRQTALLNFRRKRISSQIINSRARRNYKR
jgi:hypothetical protein